MENEGRGQEDQNSKSSLTWKGLKETTFTCERVLANANKMLWVSLQPQHWLKPQTQKRSLPTASTQL